MKSLLCANLKWRRTSWINIWKIGIKTRLLSLNFFALWKICTSITSKYWFFPSTLSFIWHVKLGNVYDRFLQNSANLQFSLYRIYKVTRSVVWVIVLAYLKQLIFFFASYILSSSSLEVDRLPPKSIQTNRLTIS